MYNRESVSFNIPKDTGYLYSGIEEFKGLHIVDNPFVATEGSASDILNLYIDETHKLVTRPRLDYNFKITNLQNIPTEYTDVIYIDNLMFFLGSNKLYEVNLSTNIVTEITPANGYSITNKKLKIFTLNNVYYFFDGLVSADLKEHIAYYNTATDELKPVTDFYVPTTTIGRTPLFDGTAFDDLNILTNKYRETWRWDKSWSIIDDSNTQDVPGKGLFVSQNVLNKNGEDISVPITEKIIQMTKKGVVTITKVAPYIFRCYDFNNVLVKTYSDIQNIFNPTEYDLIVFSDDFSVLAWWDTDAERLTVNHKNTDSSIVNDSAGYGWGNNNLNISGDGSTVVLTSQGGYYSRLAVTKAKYKFTGDGNLANDYTFVFANDTFVDYSMGKSYLSYDGVNAIFEKRNPAGAFSGLLIYKNFKTATSLVQSSFVDIDSGYIDSDVGFISLTHNATNLIVNIMKEGKYETLLYKNILVEMVRTNITNENLNIPLYNIHISEYEESFWASSGSYLIYAYNYTHSLVLSKFLINGPTIVNTPSIPVGDTIYVKLPTANGNDNVYKKLLFEINAVDQEIVYEKTLTIDNKNYTTWLELSNRNSFCNFYTNFKNDYWVASDKYIFSSLNNNPLYFPIGKYNKFNNTITGFNRLGDNLMAVYSEKQIYLQQPVEQSDGSYIMTSTETRAIKGNIAIDEPIITTYSTMPVHINKDGIFALQLEENVQSSDRLTVLITEKINKKLLAEDMSTCKTYNFKYYTYFVFPKTTTSNVYVLDNRSLEWFYWELPIKVLNLLEINAEMWAVAKTGEVYIFKTEDELEAVSSSVTIYADEVTSGQKTVIPWKWLSQLIWFDALNYKKQLLSTSFIVLDDDEKDSYGLTYNFKVYRKYYTSATSDLLISGNINYIKTVVQRTYISSFNYIKLEIKNPYDPSNSGYNENDSNKLSLVSVLFKYKVLPGGI